MLLGAPRLFRDLFFVLHGLATLLVEVPKNARRNPGNWPRYYR